MAHPNDKILGNAGFFVVDENQGAITPPDGRVFVAFRNTGAAGTFAVKGHDIYEYVAANGGDGTHYGADGVLLGSTHDAGYYRAKETQAVNMEVDAGGTVHGKFTSIDATDSDKALAYLGNG